MKCSLQEFQHMFPQLTSCVRKQSSNNNLNNNMPNSSNDSHLNNSTYIINEQHHDLQFSPMECPILPLDPSFKCKDMLHEEFCVEQGPLWRVQLIDESTMDIANLRFGPELAALLEDTEVEASTRWRYFLRYHQGSVNQVRNLKDNSLLWINSFNYTRKLIGIVSLPIIYLNFRQIFRITTKMKRVTGVLY